MTTYNKKAKTKKSRFKDLLKQKFTKSLHLLKLKIKGESKQKHQKETMRKNIK